MYSSVYDPPLSGGFRIGVFDTSVLTQDITAALKRGEPSSILAGMRYGTLRGFIPHYVWAEVPCVLADRKDEGGDFDLVKAERLWWEQYVPLLHVVCVNGLPMSAAADRLAQEDLSDVGILQLADVLAPLVLLAAYRDLIRLDAAARDWPALRAVLGKIGAAERAVRGSDTLMALSGRSLAGTARLARAHPLAAGAVAVAAGIYAYRNRARLPQTRATLSRLGMEVLQSLAEPYARHGLHTATWRDAERGVAVDDALSLVARLLARADDSHRHPGGPAGLRAAPAPPADGRAGPPPAPFPRLPPARPREVAVRQDQYADHRPALGVAEPSPAPWWSARRRRGRPRRRPTWRR